jgi:hypothetical protein
MREAKNMNNKKTMIGLAVAFLTLNGIGYSPLALAQSERVGGGGDILTCTINSKTTYHLLDMYEDQSAKIDLGSPTLSMDQKVDLAAAIYSTLDPARAKQYLVEAKKILQDIEALEKNEPAPNQLVNWNENGKKLKDIDDADEVYEFENCTKDQLVRQDYGFDSKAPYTINRDLFNKLDADQKVATLYHEVIYKDFRAHGAVVSRNARWLNRQIMSNNIQNISQKRYLEFLTLNQLKEYKVAGLIDAFNAEKIEYDAQDNITKMVRGHYFDDKNELTVGNTKLVVRNAIFKDNTLLTTLLIQKFTIKDNVLMPESYDSPQLLGGSIASGINDTLIISNLTKPNDIGYVNLVIDQNGKILSRSETTQYKKELSAEMKDTLSDLLACLKPLATKPRNSAIVQSFIEKTRTAIATEDFSLMDSLAKECESTQTTTLVATISNEAKEIAEGLGIKKLKTKDILSCNGFNISVEAALVFGLKVGAGSLTCTYSNGVRRVYATIKTGLLMGSAGAAISFGQIDYTPILNSNDSKTGAVTPSVGILSEYKLGTATLAYSKEKSGDHHDDGASSRQQHSIGLYVGINEFSGHFMIRIGKKKDSFDLVIEKIKNGIAVPAVK